MTFRETIRNKLATTTLTYDFEDLDYPAVGVGINNLLVTLGALVGSGEAYTFGRSVADGSIKLQKMINQDSCTKTKYIIGGYSQGAIVVSRTLPKLSSDKILYAATFGDPKIYLPEGKGPAPAACRGENLSDYRMYVPDCQTYHGMLGGYVPYEPENFSGKVGTWCNSHDFFCSPYLNMAKHSAYVSDNLYEDASRVIFDKICKYFGIESKISSPHDTAIMIDSTASMSALIDQFKDEAMRLAQETLASGGRVALYDYRDLFDPYVPVKHCDFATCDLKTFKRELEAITTNGGGDISESLLSAAFKVMNELEWKFGATKSMIILTDSDYLSPDRDGTTFDQVVRLSRAIDPVNFYIVTRGSQERFYQQLASETDGKVVTDFDQLNLLTDYIMERYDSLPRVEEGEPLTRPELMIESVKQIDNTAKIIFRSDAPKTLVALNDAVLGVTDQNEITLTDLDLRIQNKVILVPMNDEMRGEPVEVEINGGVDYLDALDIIGDARQDLTQGLSLPELPKAPNAGKC